MPPPRGVGTIPPSSEEQTVAIGAVLSDRYLVIDLLGAGGMGAVYKVFDQRLTRVVALKTIHPHLAATPVMMKRFKQEVLLAQKITHKNVVRIFDIGEDNGVNFITMDFIEGVSLKDMIVQRGKFPAKDAIAMMREVCLALEAAHAEGVVHRDLKPQNIMIDTNQHVVVMDFGIARSAESTGTTQTGALLGTPDYMSPEQARMEEVDARSDIFSLGLIFYELLTGKLAFSGKTAVETMFVRTKERAIPPAEIDHSIPAAANDIAVKCLEPEREKRYQRVTDILADLEAVDPTKKAGAGVVVKARLRKASRYRYAAAAVALIVVASLAGYMLRSRFAPAAPAKPHDNVSVFIADFANHTGDAALDNAVEPVIKLGLEQAGFISAFDHNLAATSGKIDETAATKIAVGQGLGFVVSGSLDQKNGAFALSIKATEAVTGKVLKSQEETASNRDQVLYAAGKLASAVRKALGDESSDDTKRFAMEALSATSLEAVREYAAAIDAISNSKYPDALKRFSNAVDIDPNFGLAYAGMAVASRNQGKQEDAEKYIRLALERIDRMTERERYRTRAYSYSIFGNRQKCVEEYSSLIAKFPSDVAAHNNLGNCLTQLRDMPKAIEEARQASAILPKRPLYRNNLALYTSYASDYVKGEREARAVREMSPEYATAFVALAFAQIGQGKPADASATYKELEGLPLADEKKKAANASTAQAGLADVAIYEGRFADAAKILEQAAPADVAAGAKEKGAIKFAALAYTRLQQGQKPKAIAAAKAALENSPIMKVKFLSAMVLASAGEEAKAKELASELGKEIQPEPQAYAKVIEGMIALEKKDPRAAIPLFTEAKKLVDTWIGRFQLGRAYLEAGAFTEADGEFDRCLKRSGEALALFLDESPTYGYFPMVHYYLGRAREGMKTSGFADSYRAYVAIRGKAAEDPLLADVRKRIGS